jgi:hypothetical protein
MFNVVITYRYPEFREKVAAMAISVNRSTSGFRKWSEAQELKKLEKGCRDTGKSGGVAAPELTGK